MGNLKSASVEDWGGLDGGSVCSKIGTYLMTASSTGHFLQESIYFKLLSFITEDIIQS
jgi:hypothetical protein